MEQEGLVRFSLVEGLDLLLVIGRPEGGYRQRLRLTPGEDR